MSDITPTENKPTTIKSFFESNGVKEKFNQLLGKRSVQFVTSVLQVAMNNPLLSKAAPLTIYNAACVAATLDLPINNNLGFAYIVPYKGEAQFQLGYKGFMQLALRSGTVEKINVTDVREGEIKKWDRLSGDIDFEFIDNLKERESKPIIGYAAYVRTNSIEKTIFDTVENLEAHALRYSQGYRSRKEGVWKDNKPEMCKKTMIKRILNGGYVILSTDMQMAISVDQSVIKNDTGTEYKYVDADAEDITVNKEHERILLFIDKASTIEDLDKIYDSVPDELMDAYLTKKEKLSGSK